MAIDYTGFTKAQIAAEKAAMAAQTKSASDARVLAAKQAAASKAATSGLPKTTMVAQANALLGTLNTRLASATAQQQQLGAIEATTKTGITETITAASEARVAAAESAATIDRILPPSPGAIAPVVDPVEAAKDKILTDTLISYGMEGIGKTVSLIRSQNPKITSDDLLFLLKNDPRYNTEYLKRFSGNAKLKAQGLPTMDDSTYLKTEKEYERIFTAYGAKGLANRDYYGTLIGNAMDAVDVTDRLNLAYTRLQSTPEVKSAFKQFYSAITDGDILTAMMDPGTQVPLLEKKVVAAEIGGAALAQGLQTSLISAADLQAYGITKAGAQTGYAAIAPKLERGKQLTQFAPELGLTYNQQLAEDIQFKKSASALKQEERIVGAELSKWGGSAGTMGSKAFASQQRGAGLI